MFSHQFLLACLHTNAATLTFYLPCDNSPQVWCVQYQYLHKAAKVTALCSSIVCNCKCMLSTTCVCVLSTFISTLACSADNSVAQCKQACKSALFPPPAAVGLHIGSLCVCVCLGDFREVKCDCNGGRATIICNIRYLNVQVCVSRIKMKHSSLFRWVLALLFLSFSSCLPLIPTAPDFAVSVQRSRQ